MTQILISGTYSHYHTFIQRRSVLVQNSAMPKSTTPSHDNLCIVSDIPIPDCNEARSEITLTPVQAARLKGYQEKLNKGFHRSIGPSKYRFRPSFWLNKRSEKWYPLAFVYFVLEDIAKCWEPLVQACIEHVQYRVETILLTFCSIG